MKEGHIHLPTLYIVDYNCSGVWCANVSHLNVTATPWLKIRTRFVPMVTCVRYPAGHINISLHRYCLVCYRTVFVSQGSHLDAPVTHTLQIQIPPAPLDRLASSVNVLVKWKSHFGKHLHWLLITIACCPKHPCTWCKNKKCHVV